MIIDTTLPQFDHLPEYKNGMEVLERIPNPMDSSGNSDLYSIVAPDEPEDPTAEDPLIGVISEYLKIVDTMAAGVRRTYITEGVGQSMTYLEKAEQAVDYAAAGYPADLSNFPHILSESLALDKTGQEIADGIIQKRTEWIALSAQIEGIRIKSKADLGDASSIEQADAIYTIARTDFTALLPTQE